MTERPSENLMRAVVVAEHGGPDVLEIRDVPRPVPGPGDLLVAVGASGVNFIDVYQREGRYPVPTPFILGGECAGPVLAVGDQVRDFSVGQVVASCGIAGTHAELAIVPADRAVAVPDNVSPEIAAAAMLQGMTAHYLTRSTYVVGPDDVVLIHAAAGGMGQLLLQLTKARGAQVIATVGSADKATIAWELGADEVLRTDIVEDLAADVRVASRRGGVTVVYDGVGQATFEASLASLLPRGMLALFGAASGPVPPFDLQRLNAAGSLFITRPTLAHYIATREELLWRAGEVLDAIAGDDLHISIGGRYGLADAAQAYRDLEGRRTTGKLLIIP